MEKELLFELEESYKNNDFTRTLELCSDLYEFKTSKELSEESSAKLELIINMSLNGLKPLFEEIKNALYGLIELATAPLN